MCGIAGFAGGDNAAKIVYDILERLEYRGYDSSGIACVSRGKIVQEKYMGRVQKLRSSAHSMQGTAAIGHTRWATHGAPSDINAHPHLCGRFSIVHNGIIENYEELKDGLARGGESFLSETDSEVIAHLLNKNYSGDLLSALKTTADMLQGSYAIAVLCEDFNGFAVIKNKSPVILGFGENGNFCASDENALAGFCKNICLLQDGDIAVVTAEDIKIYDRNGVQTSRQIIETRADIARVTLGDWPHFMLKEIGEVPLSIKNTCSVYDENDVKSAICGARRVILIGCGTAYHAALLGKLYIEAFARVPAEAEISSEFRYKNPVLTKDTAVIAVTQSGETADTVEAAKLAAASGARVIAVTNSPRSEIVRVAHTVVPVAAGAEICVAATKSYTGQAAALYLLAKTLAGGDGREDLYRMHKAALFTVKYIDMGKLAHICARSGGIYFLGRGADYAVALEASLKLKEVSYIHSEGYPAGEIKHGTLALVEKGVVVVVIITDSALAKKSVNAVHEVLSRGGSVAVITTIKEIAEELSALAEVIRLPVCDKYLSPLITAIAVQKLAYKTAVLSGHDPDKPRNLAKSVTVE